MYFGYGGHRIFYRDSGKGDIIVLLHGYLESSAVWTSFTKGLEPEFRVISVDLPGHGKSDVIDGIHTMELMATVVHNILCGITSGRIFLIGHSLGGYVTLAFADLFPEKLSGYCLFHSHPFADTPEVREKRENQIQPMEEGQKEIICRETLMAMFAPGNIEENRSMIDRLVDDALKIPEEGIKAILKGMMARPARLSVMEKGQVPCLWILGLRDNFISFDSVTGKVDLSPSSDLVMLKNSGHIGFVEEEDYTVRIIIDFVKRLSSP
jgi:pimeloyl-ACP methyl ester carboxylesterase